MENPLLEPGKERCYAMLKWDQFVPNAAERSEKQGLNLTRWKSAVILSRVAPKVEEMQA